MKVCLVSKVPPNMWPIVSIDRQVVDKSNEYVSAFLSSGYLIQLLYVMTWVYMISLSTSCGKTFSSYS